MRCAIYVRVSTSDGRQDTENQLLQLQAYAELQGWKVVRVYSDQASGKSSDREALQRMLSDAQKHRFDVLLFWSLDRLSRQGVLPTLQMLVGLSDACIAYKSFTEQYLDSCGIFKDAVVSILATIAKQERIRISERTKAGLARQKEKGTLGPNGYAGPGKPRTPFDVDIATKMRLGGSPYRDIGKALGVSHNIVHRYFTAAVK